MKRKTPAFTLIEMMISLSLFAIAMLAIINLLSASMRLMTGVVGSDESRTQAILLSRIMDSIVRDSYQVTQLTNGTVILQTFSGTRQDFYVKGKQVYLDKRTAQGLVGQKVFSIDKAIKINMAVIEESGRKAVDLLIDMPGQDISKIMILGYKKGEAKNE